MIPPHSARARGVAVAALVMLAAGVHAAVPAKPPASAAAAREHVVVKGDTLGAIARRYGVTVAALVAANHFPSERVKLRLGQRLTVPDATAGAKTSHATTTAKAALSSARATRGEAGLRETRGCCGPRTCCGPRNLVLLVPDFIDLSPLFAWPVEGPVTSTFGRRRAGWHRGIDIKADRGSAVFASAPGVVVASDSEPRYGRVVKIEHDGGFLTVYAHNEENLVEMGMRVAAGDPIATIGRTGRATAHHLHFEIRRDGSVYNPLYMLPLPPQVSQVEESDETEEDHD